MEKTLEPSLRFKGFTDAWEQCELGEIADIVGGGTPSTLVSDYWNGDIDWYSPVEIGDKIYVDSSQKKITQLGFDSSSARILPVGSVLFTSRAGIGKAAILAKQGCTNQGFQSILPKQDRLDSYFIYSRALEIKKYSETVGAGSTFIEVSGKQLSKMPIMVPGIKEQELIGSHFEKIDNLITLHQRKYDKLSNVKKALLDKMFPKNGELVPSLRFKGFTDTWEHRKLGELVYISTGKLDANAMIENGAYDFYTSGIKKYRIDTPAFEGPAITIAGNGATVGYMHLADGKFNAYQRTYVIEGFQADRQFLYSEIGNRLPRKITEEARTGNIPYIVMDMLTNLNICIPVSKDEQAKIGSLFNNLDNLITLHQRKYEKLVNIKKALLQKMFV